MAHVVFHALHIGRDPADGRGEKGEDDHDGSGHDFPARRTGQTRWIDDSGGGTALLWLYG